MKIDNYTTNHSKVALQPSEFPCEQCGSELTFQPGSQHLQCHYCGYKNLIHPTKAPIKEYDFHSALEDLNRLKRESSHVISVLKCSSCGAQFTLQPNEHAGDCHFCGAPAVINSENSRHIHPESLLPFFINQKKAQALFDDWIGSRWFAPSSLKNKAKRDENLVGIYLPYWTYDSQTSTHYQGMRGTIYYERQLVTRIINGRRVRQSRNVPRIRWTPVSGHVDIYFDDVLIGASQTLPRTIIDHLHPWDLDNLVPYSDAYLSGFRSEIYQVSVDEGFKLAKVRMDSRIKQAIYRDIGGDQQSISSLKTGHYDTTFKHLLLPVWSAAFRYRNKSYRFVVNGRNGKIQGERPYSVIKISLAVIFALIVLIGVILMTEQGSSLPQIFDSNNNYYNTWDYRQ